MYKLLVFLVVSCIYTVSYGQNETFSETRLIAKSAHELIDESRLEGALESFPEYSIRALRSKSNTGIYFIDFINNTDVIRAKQALENTNLFEYVELDYVGTAGGKFMIDPNDTHYASRQWGLKNSGNFSLATSKVDADIDMDQAWEQETGDPDLVIAILDTGLKMDHPEVKDRLWINDAESSNGGDSDGNGYVDDNLTGWDFVNEDNNPTDDHGHGSNVTSIIGSEANNTIGFAGVNWNSKLMNLKIINSDNMGFYSWWTEAIYYAVDNGASVLNMSVGGSGFSSSMKLAVDYARDNDVVVVACMMNENTNDPFYPARYESTIAVGATNPDDTRTEPFFWNANSGSNYGSHHDLIAPGHYVYGISYSSNTNYNGYWGGTSQAAPHVTGVVSLLQSIDTDLGLEEIRTILQSTAEDEVGDSDDTPGFDYYYGHGRLNANEALKTLVVRTNDWNNNESVILSPNPIKEGSNIQISWENIEVDEIQIINSVGQKVYSKSHLFGGNSTNLSSAKLIAGTYFIQLRSKGQLIAVKKCLILE